MRAAIEIKVTSIGAIHFIEQPGNRPLRILPGQKRTAVNEREWLASNRMLRNRFARRNGKWNDRQFKCSQIITREHEIWIEIVPLVFAGAGEEIRAAQRIEFFGEAPLEVGIPPKKPL